PIRHQWPRLQPEIGPDEAAQFGDRVSLYTDRVLEPSVGVRRVLIGLRETPSRLVIKPAVVVAAQPTRLDIAIAEIGAAMPAVPVDEPPPRVEILVQHEVFAQEPNRLRA